MFCGNQCVQEELWTWKMEADSGKNGNQRGDFFCFELDIQLLEYPIPAAPHASVDISETEPKGRKLEVGPPRLLFYHILLAQDARERYDFLQIQMIQ